MTKIKSNVAVSESGFVFNPITGESYSVNPVAAEIFNMLKENKSFDEIEKELLEKYQVDAETLEKDFNDFISMLKQYQIIDENNEKEV
ncbi:MAG: HPr-rel-A system PqqD family peptide chaperone [Bacteroidales bacterium]|nr:HPr-rel-A system PqqD family peptide chaperone [Bacteroidales bacterium]MCF8386571.1 HPr-rel-A system PqqD family peptide chaperone [Bacteroidales bacterium]MCF8397784.1 HPr-rel-A system PqqD family peptide chaperone [Bacteroidales bacterium]